MKKHNFTLVELLIVIGIVAVLAGLVFPALAGARASARKTQCLSNQGQLMKLLATSMNADNQQLVSGVDNNLTNGTFSRPLWLRYLNTKNRVHDLTAYRCPSIVTTRKASLASSDSTDDNSLVNKLYTAYGVVHARGTGTMANHPQKLSMTKPNYTGFDFRGTKYLTYDNHGSPVQISANQLVLGGCSAASAKTNNSSDTSAKVEIGDALSKLSFAQSSNSGTMGRIADVHNGESNLFYLDGHADSVNKDKFSDNRFYPGLFKDGRDSTAQDAIPNALPIPQDNWFNPDDL